MEGVANGVASLRDPSGKTYTLSLVKLLRQLPKVDLGEASGDEKKGERSSTVASASYWQGVQDKAVGDINWRASMVRGYNHVIGTPLRKAVKARRKVILQYIHVILCCLFK